MNTYYPIYYQHPAVRQVIDRCMRDSRLGGQRGTGYLVREPGTEARSLDRRTMLEPAAGQGAPLPLVRAVFGDRQRRWW